MRGNEARECGFDGCGGDEGSVGVVGWVRQKQEQLRHGCDGFLGEACEEGLDGGNISRQLLHHGQNPLLGVVIAVGEEEQSRVADGHHS